MRAHWPYRRAARATSAISERADGADSNCFLPAFGCAASPAGFQVARAVPPRRAPATFRARIERLAEWPVFVPVYISAGHRALSSPGSSSLPPSRRLAADALTCYD
jgi:hypothetical protein